MATALDLIEKSMRLFGALSDGESATASEAGDGLDGLNTMLDSWSIERLMVYHILQENFTWASGNASRTIGSGGNFDTTRPTKIVSGFTRISNVDYPFQVVEREHYDAITDKTTQSSYPEIVYYDGTMSTGVVYGYPVPNASITVYINSWKQLQQFSALSTDLALPPGYRRAIEYNFAIEFASEFGMDVPARVERIANESKAAIKRINSPSIVAAVELAGGGRYNINAG